MFIHSTPDDELIPHRDNIRTVIENHEILNTLRWLNPTIAGGFATALFAAPRVGSKSQYISRQWYKDIDIYPVNEEERQEIIDFIEDNWEGQIIKRHETERAKSFTVKTTEKQEHSTGKTLNQYSIHHLQVMCIPELEGEVENVFSTYDFIMSCVAFKPKTLDVWFHQDFVKLHKAKELELHKPTMLTQDSTDEELITQLLRIHKYCDRWDFDLSENLLKKMMEVYQARPDVQLDPEKIYRMHSGEQKGMLTHCKANIWKLLSSLILKCPHYAAAMDTVGHINGVYKPETIDMNEMFTTMLVNTGD